jgi:hypothetical protein
MIPLAVLTSLTFASFDYPDIYGVLIRYGEYPREPSFSLKNEWMAFHNRYGPQPVWDPRTDQQTGPRPSVMYEWQSGTVVVVSDKAIEIRVKGRDDTKKFTPHTLLATGRIPIWESMDSRCYLLEDARKGDEVELGVGTVDPAEGMWRSS